MTAKRIAAIAIAAVLIVAALLIRNGLDDDSSSATDGTDKPTGGKITVICSTEFEAICSGLDSKKYTATTEPAGDTLDRLAEAGAALPDAWITLDPFPGMIDEIRRSSGVPPLAPAVGVAVVATDTPVLAVSASFFPSIGKLCGGTITWKCAGSNAGESLENGGDLLPGLTNPDDEAGGLVTFANAIASYFNSTDLDASEWEDNGLVGWLRNFHANVKVTVGGEAPLSSVINRKTFINVGASTTSEAAGTNQQSAFKTVQATPSIAYAAVVATFGNRAGSLASVVGPLLVNAGWTKAGDPKSTLPAGTFVALRTLWEGK